VGWRLEPGDLGQKCA